MACRLFQDIDELEAHPGQTKMFERSAPSLGAERPGPLPIVK